MYFIKIFKIQRDLVGNYIVKNDIAHLSQRDLQILFEPFFGKMPGFYFNQEHVVKNKKLWFPAKICEIRKNIKE